MAEIPRPISLKTTADAIAASGGSNDFISSTSGIAGTAGPPTMGIFALPGMILNNATPQLGPLSTSSGGLQYYPLKARSEAINGGNNSALGTIAAEKFTLGLIQSSSINAAIDEIGNLRITATDPVIDIGAIGFSPPSPHHGHHHRAMKKASKKVSVQGSRVTCVQKGEEVRAEAGGRAFVFAGGTGERAHAIGSV